MIRCIAVDDEAYAAEIIASFIRKTPALTLSGVYTSALEALQVVQQGQVDLLFLDVQMPELTGIQLMNVIGRQCRVILTTAYPDYALEGYDLDVVDYLMKPVAFDRFLRAVSRAQQAITDKATQENTTATPRYIFVKGDNKHSFVKLNLADILYIEGLKNYVCIHTRTEKVITYQRMSAMEAELGGLPFIRIHKSYIVSLDHIERIEGNAVSVGGKFLPVGEVYRQGFYEVVKQQ
jgi:DNA-binding LytR/AlgR family response regulator